MLIVIRSLPFFTGFTFWSEQSKGYHRPSDGAAMTNPIKDYKVLKVFTDCVTVNLL